jgi:WD40 repeat protein
VKFQPYSCLFVSGSGDKTVSLWDIRTNLCVQTFYGHNNSVNSVSFNIRGDSIASCDSDGMVRIWDVRMVKEIMNFDTGLASANNAVFDKSCSYVFVASEDSSVKVYNLHSKEKEAELKGHEDAVLDLCFDNGKEGYLLTASSDCSFRLWQ